MDENIEQEHVIEAFSIAISYLLSMGYTKANEYDGCIEQQVDEHWWIALNGHNTPQVIKKNNMIAQPYHIYIEFNGWPAGVMTPFDGQIAAGECANEATFIQALTSATLANEAKPC